MENFLNNREDLLLCKGRGKNLMIQSVVLENCQKCRTRCGAALKMLVEISKHYFDSACSRVMIHVVQYGYFGTEPKTASSMK